VGTFDQLLDKLDADNGVKGQQFERIAKWFLINDPAYKSLLRHVWLWKEWRDRWSDLEAGIDIVAEDFSGKFWAVQCKAYRADRTITKADIDKFLSESNRPVFAERLLIATTDNIHHVARNTMSAQAKNVAVVGLEALRLTDSYLDWPETRAGRPTRDRSTGTESYSEATAARGRRTAISAPNRSCFRTCLGSLVKAARISRR